MSTDATICFNKVIIGQQCHFYRMSVSSLLVSTRSLLRPLVDVIVMDVSEHGRWQPTTSTVLPHSDNAQSHASRTFPPKPNALQTCRDQNLFTPAVDLLQCSCRSPVLIYCCIYSEQHCSPSTATLRAFRGTGSRRRNFPRFMVIRISIRPIPPYRRSLSVPEVRKSGQGNRLDFHAGLLLLDCVTVVDIDS